MLAPLDQRAVEGTDRVEAGGLCVGSVLSRLLHRLLHQLHQAVARVVQCPVPPLPVKVVGVRGRLRHKDNEAPEIRFLGNVY